MIETTTSSISLEELLRAGAHFGHRRSKRHPRNAPHIKGVKDTIELIDLAVTSQRLEAAMGFLRDRAAQANSLFLFVGTKPHIKKVVREAAESCGMPYVVERWIGGTITNFVTTSKRVNTLKDLEEKRRLGELEKYTKREQLLLTRKIERLSVEVGGLRKLTRLPDVVILATPRADATAVREAQKKGIPAVAIIDTDVDPAVVTHPIPGNDDAISSVRYILSALARAIQEGRASSVA